MNNLTVVIVVGVAVVLALFGIFLRRVSKEQGSIVSDTSILTAAESVRPHERE